MTEIDEVRAAFEAKFDHEYPMERRGDHYRCWSTECIWRGYQVAHAAGRRKGLEEAAKATDKLAKRAVNRGSQIVDVACKECANAIRALIDKETT